jgi:hypothetical protein
MGRARTGLILVALLVLAACSKTGSPVASSNAPSTTVSTPTPRGSGYPLAKGRRVEITKGQTGTVGLTVGDVLALQRFESGTKPSGEVLVLAEVTDAALIFQAVAAGKATLSTDDPPPARTCPTTPCPPGRAAPPVLTVEVKAS